MPFVFFSAAWENNKTRWECEIKEFSESIGPDFFAKPYRDLFRWFEGDCHGAAIAIVIASSVVLIFWLSSHNSSVSTLEQHISSNEPPNAYEKETESIVNPIYMRVKAPNEVNVRTGPNAEYGVVKKIVNGDFVSVHKTENGWSYIGDGWVNSKFLNVYEKEPESTGNSIYMRVKAPNEVNVRAGPNAEYGVVKKIVNGDFVSVHKTENGWSYIGDGWVNSKFLYDPEGK